MSDIASISFFHFKGLANRWWAFKQMQLARSEMAEVQGSSFMKLMGCGNGGGFSIVPDFGTYALFSTWQEVSDYRRFLDTSSLLSTFIERSNEHFHILLRPYRSHGTWSGLQPFSSSGVPAVDQGYMAVLTRATIRRSRMISFWKLVPSISRVLKDQPGLVFSRGMGEWPLFELTTFSVWQSSEAMMKFAYSTQTHQKAVKHTREKGLFTEDLFARFGIEEMLGIWEGQPVQYTRAGHENTTLNANFVENPDNVFS